VKTSRDVTAVVLAGGRARRMGGQDKGLIELNRTLLIEYALAALAGQVDTILVNANRNIERYAGLGYPVIEDRHSGFNGPLAGMASALSVMQTRYLVTVPCDSPALPQDLVDRLLHARSDADAELAVAHDGTRIQPVFALLQRTLLPDLEQFLDAGGRKIDQWYAQHRLALTDFSDQPDAFVNVNTPEDLARLSQMSGLPRVRRPVTGQRLP
jgi:molybdopterin-guanine dinucleotide biosynthesis protein A